MTKESAEKVKTEERLERMARTLGCVWVAKDPKPPEDDPEPPKDDEDEYGPDREETDDR